MPPPAPLRPLCSQGLGTVTPHQMRVRGVRCPPGSARSLQPQNWCSRTPCALCSQIPPRKMEKKNKMCSVGTWQVLKG